MDEATTTLATQATYLDCNATTPVEPEVLDLVVHYLKDEFGNAGSRTHEYGQKAKAAVELARRQVAKVVSAEPEEVVFTSGATEANNLAILGLARYAQNSGRTHVVSTSIEHKAVLEPLEELARRGIEVTLVGCDQSGRVSVDAVLKAVREDTALVSVMHVNNETGVVQPLQEIALALANHDCFLHTDAAQGFGKEPEALQSDRIDLISVSGHKLYAPKGVGALICRRRGYKRPPIEPTMYGGGQERGLRPGTLPVALIAGFGLASEIANRTAPARDKHNRAVKNQLLKALGPLGAKLHGDPQHTVPHVLNLSLPGLDSEAVMLALKGDIAISNGSACTSASYRPSHVLTAMGIPVDQIEGAIRVSWCHLTPPCDWTALAKSIEALR